MADPASADTKRLRPNNTSHLTSQSEANQGAQVTPAQIAYNELASAFYVINSKYSITWECADLLIELGGGSVNGNSNDDYSSPSASASAPITSQFTSAHSPEQGSIGVKHGRGRAITLAGDETKPTQPPLVASYSVPGSTAADHTSPISSPSNGSAFAPHSMSWRTSTGRHHLSQRQLVLLGEMLNNAHAHSNVAVDTDDIGANLQADKPLPEKSVLTSRSHNQPRMLLVAVNKDWKWGDPKNSTVTLPSVDGDRFDNGKTSTDHKRRSGKLGMSGLRDLLRALKRSAVLEETPHLASAIPIQSTTSLSTESSTGSRRLRKPRQPSQQRRNRTGTGPDSVRSALENGQGQRDLVTASPYGASFATAKPSPRRPSLASIFRIGGKNRPSNKTNDEAAPAPRSEPADGGISAQSSGGGEDSSGAEEDWDRMDSASDLDTAAKALGIIDGSATARGGSRGEGRKKKSLYLQQDSSPQLGAEQFIDRPLVTKRSFGASQISIRDSEHQSMENFSQSGSVPSRPVRLSNVEEHADDASSVYALSSARSVSQTHPDSNVRLPKCGVGPSCPGFSKSGSVRSMPVHVASMTSSPANPLAMTPENIKPLLENAKEVQARLGHCIAELRALIKGNIESGIKDGVAFDDDLVAA